MSDREVEITCEVRRETDQAYLLYDGAITEWVPKSVVSDECRDDNGALTSVFLPEWLAEEKGFL